MAFERALVIAVVSTALWFAVRRMLVPFLVWLLGPTIKRLSAARTRIAADAELEASREEERAARIALEIDDTSSRLVEDLVRNERAWRKK